MPKKKKPYNLERKIVNALRKLSRSSPIRYEALRLSSVIDEKGKPTKYKKCAKCHKKFRKEYVRVDHIDQVGKEPQRQEAGWIPCWDEYIMKLNCPPISNLQVLCIDCHETKSQVEKQMRKSNV